MKHISLNWDARFKIFNWKEKENARLPNTYGARLYKTRMIMYARALYRSFKVKWIGEVYFPTHVLFIINAVIRGRIIMYARALYSSFKV